MSSALARAWWIGTDCNDRMHGWPWAENRIFGGDGNDRLIGGIRDDSLHGGDGRDALHGLFGDDELAGQGGRDRIYGHHGEDTIIGGTGDDRLWGGQGQDNFVFRSGDGNDVIHDFDTGIWGSWHGCGWFFGAPSYGDVITLDVEGIDSFEDLMQHAEHKRGSVVFDLGEDDSLTLKGTRLHQLDADDFIFV